MPRNMPKIPQAVGILSVETKGWWNALAFSHNDRCVFGADYGPPKVVDLSAATISRSFPKSGIPNPTGVCWTILPVANEFVLAGIYGTIARYDADGNSVQARYISPKGIVSSCDVSIDHSRLVFGTWEKRLVCVDLASNEICWDVSGKTSFSCRVAITPDGKHCITGGNDKSVRMFALDSGKELSVLGHHEGFVQGLDVSSDGKFAVTGGRDRKVRIWNIAEGRETNCLVGHRKEIRAVQVAPNGQFIVSAGGDGAKVWSLDGSLIGEFNEHGKSVACIAIASDSRRIATAGEDGYMRIWEH